jgi:hypothetical protein
MKMLMLPVVPYGKQPSTPAVPQHPQKKLAEPVGEMQRIMLSEESTYQT